MKKRIRLSMAFIATIMTMALSSCFIENDGPVGPPGENGWSDIKVITYNINYNQWLRDNSQLNYWYYEYYTNLVDYYVVDKGTVLFYYGYIENNGFVNKWFSIPFTNVYYDGGSGRYYEKIYDAIYSPGKLEIEIRDNNSIRFDWPDDRDVRIKAVILEGTLYNQLKTENVDLKNYNAVMNAVKFTGDSCVK
ncbi:MAG: hypothetical protein V1779_06025 [bacterium]